MRVNEFCSGRVSRVYGARGIKAVAGDGHTELAGNAKASTSRRSIWTLARCRLPLRVLLGGSEESDGK